MINLIENCQQIYQHFSHVGIDQKRLDELAARLSTEDLPLPDWQNDFCYHGDPERTLSWIFLFSAINYSYWPEDGPRWMARIAGRNWGEKDEAIGVMAILARAIEAGVKFDDPDWLEQMDFDDFRMYFYPAAGSGALSMLKLRMISLKEMGRAFKRYNGAIGMLTTAQFSAQNLVDLLLDACPSWRDVQEYNGVELAFCKRAYMCAAMCHTRFQADPTRQLSDFETIPVFADYRLPQILRALGVLRYTPDLSTIIDDQIMIPAGSPEEIEIRATTVLACHQLVEHLQRHNPSITHLHVDACLWNMAISMDHQIPPHHRTRTLGY